MSTKIIIEKYNRPGSSRTGSLKNITKEGIEAVLGFPPNVQDDPDKVENSWGFKIDGEAFGIWDYKGSHHVKSWSTYGPSQVLIKLFPDNFSY